jgi:coenzyme F420-reducing hydrogenase delta subunit
MVFVSSGQGATFAKLTTEMVERVKKLGPSPMKHKVEERCRWH